MERRTISLFRQLAPARLRLLTRLVKDNQMRTMKTQTNLARILLVLAVVLVAVLSAQTPLSPGRGTVAAGTATTDAECWATSTALGVCTDPIFSGTVTTARYLTATNCADSAGAAACGSASAGAFVIDVGSTSTVVSTTAVTANSEIFVQFDSSLGTRLSVTCNTTPATVAVPTITARTAATSFTLSVSGTVGTNPACFSYRIEN
jgi:hypothetical protein